MLEQSFSGTHVFNPDHVVTSIELDWFGQTDITEDKIHKLGEMWAERVGAELEAAVCPRCGDAMDLDKAAGSRITSCRCIPICSACGEDEAIQPIFGHPASRIWEWPIGRSARTRRKNRFDKTAKVGILAGTDLISDEGSTPIQLREHPGGWAEFGMDVPEEAPHA